MNRSGTILRARIQGNRPGAAFVFSGGEEGDQAEQVVALADEAGQAAVGESIAAQEFGGVFVAHLCQFSFDFAADGAGSRVGAGADFGEIVFRDGGFEVFTEVGGSLRC